MTLVGFKRMHIGIFKDGIIDKDSLITIEGKQDLGATVSAEISGLSSESKKAYGSNIAYYVLQKGTGEVSVNFGILDMPDKSSDMILGYRTNEKGFSFIGDSTEPPYCAVLLETEDLRGQKALLGFFKGKFSKAEMALNTKTGEQVEPEADAYVYVPIANDAENEANGETAVKYQTTGKDDENTKEFMNLVIPGGFPS